MAIYHHWECCGIMYPLTVYRCTNCGMFTNFDFAQTKQLSNATSDARNALLKPKAICANSTTA